MNKSTLTGRLPAILSNEISDAINKALRSGMEADEAVCVVASVAADYARLSYGDDYLCGLATVVTSRAGMPAPQDVSGEVTP